MASKWELSRMRGEKEQAEFNVRWPQHFAGPPRPQVPSDVFNHSLPQILSHLAATNTPTELRAAYCFSEQVFAAVLGFRVADVAGAIDSPRYANQWKDPSLVHACFIYVCGLTSHFCSLVSLRESRSWKAF